MVLQIEEIKPARSASGESLMKTLLVTLLIALAPAVVALLVLRHALFFLVVAPSVKEKGLRFWLNTTLGSTQAAHIKSYLAGLAPEQLGRWPNWYLRYSGYIIGACIALWCLLLVAAR